jgi:hypothetical protein
MDVKTSCAAADEQFLHDGPIVRRRRHVGGHFLCSHEVPTDHRLITSVTRRGHLDVTNVISKGVARFLEAYVTKPSPIERN